MVKPNMNYGVTLRVQVTEFKSCCADPQPVGRACPACRRRSAGASAASGDNSLCQREFLSCGEGCRGFRKGFAARPSVVAERRWLVPFRSAAAWFFLWA